MTKRFEHKVALVTGAGSGIGLASAIAFANEGAKVVVADRVIVAGEEAVRLIEETRGEAIYVQCDVTKSSEVKNLIDTTVSTYGGLDIAVNNAGIVSQPMRTADLSEEEWDRVMNVNLRGAWLCMKYEIHQMIGRKGAAIVNTSSLGGIRGREHIAPYSASKHGLNGLTRTAALEYAIDGIRINAICPGLTTTGMTSGLEDMPDVMNHLVSRIPMGRMGKSEEMAEAILWLCSDAASFVTGQVLVADGGESIS